MAISPDAAFESTIKLMSELIHSARYKDPDEADVEHLIKDMRKIRASMNEIYGHKDSD